MFTGIVQGVAPVTAIDKKVGLTTHTLTFPTSWLEGLEIGASVAHNGCCLTVTHIEGQQVQFDLMAETLEKTNLGQVTLGQEVNIERAARFGDEIGGHVMSGHIMTQVGLLDKVESENNCTLWFELPAAYQAYVLEKGFIGLNGCSLTIGQVEDDRFCVHLIPETLSRTLFGRIEVGDQVNLEIDSQTQAIVDTVQRVLAAK